MVSSSMVLGFRVSVDIFARFKLIILLLCNTLFFCLHLYLISFDEPIIIK